MAPTRLTIIQVAGNGQRQTAPGHPARSLSSDVAGLLACGSAPLAAFPGAEDRKPSGMIARGYPLTVAGAATDSPDEPASPHSLFTLKTRDHRRD